jgi:hypothetical protein
MSRSFAAPPRAPLALPLVTLVAIISALPGILLAQQCATNDYPTDTFQGGFTQGWGKHFGGSVDIDGPVAVVGGAGHAVVYELRDNRWLFVQNLLPPDNLSSSFGFSVAVAGTTIAVGDPGLDGGAGSVWIFELSNRVWTQQARLQPSTTSYPPRKGARFGYAIDLHGDRLLIGAPGYDDMQTTVGYAFLFERTGGSWNEKAQMVPSAAHRSRQTLTGFGHSVGIDGDLAAIGMPFDIGPGASLGDPDKQNVGRVSVHEAGNGWAATASLRPGRADEGDHFGFSVAVSGTNIVAGAPFHQVTVGLTPLGTPRQTAMSGAAFVFERTALGEVKRVVMLRPDEYCTGGYTSRYGYAVDMTGDLIAIGAPTSGPGEEGETYVYERRGGPWLERSYLTKHGRLQGRTDWFGTAVAVTSGWAIVGAPRADRYVGEALIFDYP